MAALNLVQKNKEDQEQQKQNMQSAALGRGAPQAPAGGGKSGALLGLGTALGGAMGGGPAGVTGEQMGANGAQALTPEGGAELDDALSSLDQYHTQSRGGW